MISHYFFFFFNDTATTEIYTLSLHDALPISFHSAPFPLGRGCSLRTARSGQGRAGVARRSEPFTARTVLRSSTRGKGVALNGPLKWPSRSPPLTSSEGFERASATPNEFNARCRQGSDGSGNKFSPAVNRSVATGMQLVIHTGLVTRVQQQQKDDSPTDQEEAEPSLHRESASRTCRKFRSLFNSASSRKPSCSFCQAATPSRVGVCRGSARNGRNSVGSNELCAGELAGKRPSAP